MLRMKYLNSKEHRFLESLTRCFLMFNIVALLLLCSTSDCCATQPATALSIDVQSNNNTFNIANYTLDELQRMNQTQVIYSSVNAYDTPSVVAAEGILLMDLFNQLGAEPADVAAIIISTADGATTKYSSEEYLHKPRYYFAGIFGGGKNQWEVAPMLALRKYEEKSAVDPDLSKMNDAEGMSFCFGQKEITDKVSIQYGKYINKITIVLKDGTSMALPKAPYGTGEGGQVPVLEEDIDQGLTADTLTITVGYYGGPYQIKKVFTLEELYQMEVNDQVYSYIDNMPAVVLESARGISLTNLLKAARIDANSVESFHFYCSDVKTSWYQSINKEYLLDTIRYYYPNLQKCWDYEESKAGLGATEGAQEVETMIALEDNWKRFALEPDFDHLMKKSRFRLVFGQTDTTTKNAYRSARWIHTIEVMLGGKPPDNAAPQNSLPIAEVGSKVRHDDALGNAVEESQAGVQNWRVYEMSESAMELQKQETEDPLLPVVGMLAALILITGFVFGIIRYYREVC